MLLLSARVNTSRHKHHDSALDSPSRSAPREFRAATTERILAHALLSREAEVALADRIRAGDEGALHELVGGNLRLAHFLAERFARSCNGQPDQEELFSESIKTLYRVARKFDPGRSRFADYAGFHLRSALRSWINVTRHGRRRPAPTEDRVALAETAWRSLEKTGREATTEELAASLRWNLARTRRASGLPTSVSLDAPAVPSGDTLLTTLADESAPPADWLAAEHDRIESVRAALAQLDSRAQTILRGRFGFDDDGAPAPHIAARLLSDGRRNRHRISGSLRAVGAKLNLSGERVRQIENAAFAKLCRLLSAWREDSPKTDSHARPTHRR